MFQCASCLRVLCVILFSHPRCRLISGSLRCDPVWRFVPPPPFVPLCVLHRCDFSVVMGLCWSGAFLSSSPEAIVMRFVFKVERFCPFSCLCISLKPFWARLLAGVYFGFLATLNTSPYFLLSPVGVLSYKNIHSFPNNINDENKNHPETVFFKADKLCVSEIVPCKRKETEKTSSIHRKPQSFLSVTSCFTAD